MLQADNRLRRLIETLKIGSRSCKIYFRPASLALYLAFLTLITNGDLLASDCISLSCSLELIAPTLRDPDVNLSILTFAAACNGCFITALSTE